MNAQSHGAYYLPAPSYWPILGSAALLGLTLGATLLINQVAGGGWVLLAGFVLLVWMLFGWFGQVIGESEKGLYNQQVDAGFRWSMSWFIFSEVMFFAAFFGALFYVRTLSVPDLTSTDNALLWPGYAGGWPTQGPGIKEAFEPMGAWGIPAWNTLILLSSGVTVTWAHWGLKQGRRSQLIGGLIATVALGLLFIGLQAYEYHHAYTELGLTLGAGVYGATFFMLTGFHGFHVTLGTIMLITILGRSIAGHFTPERHFAFEAVSWYWHFVDVVWLGLFIFVYWL
ncbi:cytochrome c oxidase subunit 3 [Sulfuritortus calidifontis]|uniref:cytochrome-c oxidase n=1 Tax=Sulfuritortus calidifontis TaxID=1914471 RepID=A0A4R3JXX4_9PROT|nr:cytochrome c oxidase subunit 3 [Sulfuritortus calidifontis]TCS73402.1 cytochrome c oxidase subunit 3 [Sulfuritortus calidifontis]